MNKYTRLNEWAKNPNAFTDEEFNNIRKQQSPTVASNLWFKAADSYLKHRDEDYKNESDRI